MNSLEVLTRYIRCLKIPITSYEINKAFTKNTDLMFSDPNSLLAITETLTNLNIPHESFSVNPNMVNQLPLPFIAYLSSNGGEFALVEAAESGKFIVSNNQWDHLSVSIDDFQRLFSGITVLAEAGDISKQNTNKQKDRHGLTDLKASLSKGAILKPSFLVIGAQKAGSTSFYDYLSFHPNFKSALKKEIHFFNFNYYNGVDWYHHHFPSKINETDFTAEATPCYLFHPLVPERVYKYFPMMKLIVLLRDPVERAYSHYCMLVGQNFETLKFEKAIESEGERLASEFQKTVDQENYNSFNYQKFSYLSRGKYAEQIKRWLKYFKKEQFFFINSDNLKYNPDAVFSDVCRFLNVSEFKIEKIVESNTGTYPGMLPETKDKLKTYFKPYNEELFKITGINFNQ